MLSLTRFISILQEPMTLCCLCLSLEVTCVSLPLLGVVGISLGYLLGRWEGRWLSLLDLVVTLPLVFPPIATGFLLLLLLGRRSGLGTLLKHWFGIEVLFSFWGVALAACIAGLPLIVGQVRAAVRRDATGLIEAAYVLGKSRPTTFFRVVLPSIRRSVAIGLFLALARSLGEVGITLMLGGNIAGRTNTISLEVYNAVFTGEYDRALVLVILLGSISFLLILLTRRLARG